MKNMLIGPEVYCATIIGVKSPKDVLTESCWIASWEHLAVHGDKLIFGEFSFWTILDEPLVPSLKARTPVLYSGGVASLTWISSVLRLVFVTRKAKSSTLRELLLDLPPIPISLHSARLFSL